VFGGQVIGQMLVAAGKTIKENWHVHSMHGYFLQKGNIFSLSFSIYCLHRIFFFVHFDFYKLTGSEQKPILYQVDCVRDGKSFSARTVKAIQNGVVIFNGMVSYHVGETMPVESQPAMPVVAPPEELDNLENLLKKALE
jgi:acyl-CoA thioesterase